MAQRFGKFELLNRLGGGGMAEVFRARLHGPEGFAKDLALKLILPHYSDDPEFVQMFIHEATVAARLDHANIVRIHEFDQVDGRYYLAMELVDGRDLRQCLARANQLDRPLGVAEALVIGIEVCKGLAYAHGELTPGAPVVIHRDISPHNVILSRAGEVKITDLGIAKLASSTGATRSGVVKGKVAYMSPEQAAGLPLGPRSDLFSVGCVLWEMLTGQRLFTGPNDLVVLERLRSDVILPPSAHNPAVPARLDELCLQALQREPAQRIASASLLGRELERVVRSLPEFDRTTSLGEWIRGLWQGVEPRGGTAVRPVPAAPAPQDPPTLRHELQPSPGQPETPPRHAEAQADEATPIEAGPDEDAPGEPAPVDATPDEATPDEATFVDPLDVSAPDGPPLPAPRRGRTWRLVATLAALVLLAAGIVWVQAFHAGPADARSQPAPGPLARPGETAAALGALACQVARSTSDPRLAVGAATVRIGTRVTVASASPSPAAPAPAVGKPVLGRLDLNAIPWARVRWNGRLLGDTPLEGLWLPVGEQVLFLENPELHKQKRIKVRILARKPVTEVVDLR